MTRVRSDLLHAGSHSSTGEHVCNLLYRAEQRRKSSCVSGIGDVSRRVEKREYKMQMQCSTSSSSTPQ